MTHLDRVLAVAGGIAGGLAAAAIGLPAAVALERRAQARNRRAAVRRDVDQLIRDQTDADHGWRPPHPRQARP